MSKADVCAAILWFGVTLYAIFEAAEVELLEASDLGLSEPVVGELGKRRSAPE